jgi:hypothetical protein
MAETETEISFLHSHFPFAGLLKYVFVYRAYLQLKLQIYIHVHVGTAWRLKGHNPGIKGFRCVQLHNVWWQHIPIPHCSWGEKDIFLVSIRQDSS